MPKDSNMMQDPLLPNWVGWVVGMVPLLLNVVWLRFFPPFTPDFWVLVPPFLIISAPIPLLLPVPLPWLAVYAYVVLAIISVFCLYFKRLRNVGRTGLIALLSSFIIWFYIFLYI